jgi:hypothetical protein
MPSLQHVSYEFLSSEKPQPSSDSSPYENIASPPTPMLLPSLSPTPISLASTSQFLQNPDHSFEEVYEFVELASMNSHIFRFQERRRHFICFFTKISIFSYVMKNCTGASRNSSWIGKPYKDVCYQYDKLLISNPIPSIVKQYNQLLHIIRGRMEGNFDDPKLEDNLFWRTRRVKNYYRKVTSHLTFDDLSSKTELKQRGGLWKEHRKLLHLAGIERYSAI